MSHSQSSGNYNIPGRSGTLPSGVWACTLRLRPIGLLL